MKPVSASFTRALQLLRKMRQHGDRSKYMPHQGARECARRREQRGGV